MKEIPKNVIKSMVKGIVPSPANVPCNSVEGTHFTFFTLSSPLSSDEEENENREPMLFPEQVYTNLPSPLNDVVERGRNPCDKMMLLVGSMVTLSSTMAANVYFKYSKRYRPNLQAFIIGSPASGKGRSALPRRLVHAIHKEICSNSPHSKKDVSESSSERPKMQLLEFPVNITLPTLDMLIGDNLGCGLMYTADGGNMMVAIANEWGNYVNDLLASAENEGISRARKTNNEYCEIDEVRFSVLVASTWSQINKLFGNGLDGLFSRVIFINLPKATELWNSQWGDDNEESDEEYFDRLGSKYKSLYDKLKLQDSILFTLTSQQKKEMDVMFEQLANSFTQIYSEGFLPSVRRMAVTALRFMCILTILRKLNEDEIMPQHVTCSDDDLKRVLMMVETLLIHAGHRYNYLASGVQEKAKFEKWTLLLDALPEKFQRAEAIKIGTNLGIHIQRIDKYLARLCNEKRLKKVEFGVYQKVK